MSSLRDKVIFMTGGSRGIGLAIALRAARDGARVVVAAKTSEPHPKLPGTIYTAAEAIEKAGGQALPMVMDLRDDNAVEATVAKAAEHFGGIDVLINNASAINLTDTPNTPVKRFDLMMGVNVRGTFVASRACLPYLRNAANPHILTLAPPLNLDPTWFAPHLAYTISKYGMSLCVLGMAREFQPLGIAVNALWPRTVIATAALNNIAGVEPENCRKPEIVADAAHVILVSEANSHSGHFYIDEHVLGEAGVTDFERYANQPGAALLPDLFLSEDTGPSNQ